MTRLLTISLAVSLASFACESTPKPRTDDVKSAPAASADAVQLDEAQLIQTAQLLRDREFERPPTISPVKDFVATPLTGCASRCEEERRWLTRILFAGKPPLVPTPIAAWNAEARTVQWDASITDAAAVRAAVLAELVRGLDDVRTPPATTWDGYLAQSALRRGAGVFVATLDSAKLRRQSVGARDLAMRPEALYQLQFGPARFADGFATREGFAFTAALVRAGGWSAVELAHVEQPVATQQIVRPDRYLSGDALGQWTFPKPLQERREAAGYKRASDGPVGPALFVEWLSRHVPAAVARSAYIGFESDHYQVFQNTEGAWTFDWISQWNTPSTAEQVVEALDAGLGQRDDGAKFIVLRKGATVAVIGASTGDDDLATLGTELVETLPTFDQPRPRGVAFVPTPIDQLNARPQVTRVDRQMWTDSATGASLDLALLSDSWQLLPTTEPNLPWFAKHSSGAVLQYLVQPHALFDPPFDSSEYEDLVRQRFQTTMELSTPAKIERADTPIERTLKVDATGKIKDRSFAGDTHLRAWHLPTGDFVTTLSLQAPPESFDALADELGPLLLSVSSEKAPPTTEGVIKFSVED